MDQDRLVKVGRSVADLVRIVNEYDTGKGEKINTVSKFPKIAFARLTLNYHCSKLT
jgi:hypothetical protein